MEANIRNREPFIQDRLVFTCAPDRSIMQDRNWCMDHCETDIIVFVDDDIRDFPPRFAGRLVNTLLATPHCVMVSAKLLDANGEMFMGGGVERKDEGLSFAKRWLPSSCIAIYNNKVRWDESLSACDDVDFCEQLKQQHPEAVFAVDNEVCVRHLNEEKWNTGDKWATGRAQFEKKWGHKVG